VTLPQPNSIAPVLGGQQFFRLKTPLLSVGDIYESEVSGLGLALGPDSDIATVLVTYFDANAPTMLSQATISPDRALVGRIDARNETQYPGPGSRRGRVLISVDDIYDARWLPDGFNGDDAIQFETPVLDVIQYFVNAPSVAPPRSDRVFRYQYLQPPTNPGGETFVVIPGYGRKSGYFTYYNLSGGAAITIKIYGVKMSTSSAPGPVGSFQLQLATQVVLDADGGTF
jgi:hypothetical protein